MSAENDDQPLPEEMGQPSTAEQEAVHGVIDALRAEERDAQLDAAKRHLAVERDRLLHFLDRSREIPAPLKSALSVPRSIRLPHDRRIRFRSRSR